MSPRHSAPIQTVRAPAAATTQDQLIERHETGRCGHGGRWPQPGQPAAAWLCSRATRPLAVSTATAASRQ